MFKERLKLETVSFHMHLYMLLINIEDELDGLFTVDSLRP
jgi:hypothetical protein